MATTFLQLGQSRATDTNNTQIYSPGASTETLVRNLTICNTSTNDATFRLFIDADGTTYDQTTALFYDEPIAKNSSYPIDTWQAMNNAAGNIAYRSSVASALTITASGMEKT